MPGVLLIFSVIVVASSPSFSGPGSVRLPVCCCATKVNFLALDFDLTILDVHTSGRWPGTPEQLAQRIRPFFQTLIPVAIAQGDLILCDCCVYILRMCTYSSCSVERVDIVRFLYMHGIGRFDISEN